MKESFNISYDNELIENLKVITDLIKNDDLNRSNLKKLFLFFQNNPEIINKLSENLFIFLLNSKISLNLSMFGILSENGFSKELITRLYGKLMPEAPHKENIKYLIQILFPKKNDFIQVKNLGNKSWKKLFSFLFSNAEYQIKFKEYLFDEILYSLEILAIWIASKEFNEEFIRLDNTLINKDSPFIALNREVSSLINNIKKNNIKLESIKHDFAHIEVLIQQSYNLILSLKKKSVNLGISVSLTYEFERLEAILKRLEFVLFLMKTFDTRKFYQLLIELFKDSVETNCSKNSLSNILNQNIKILAKSITNNTSHHGEHYIVNDKKEYLTMFFSATGAGILIAFMALIKINITSFDFNIFLKTLFICLNYGIGFVIIHLFGFTIATKQPAMTASTFAEAIEEKELKKVNQQKLVELFTKVTRSQFAAILGNITTALIVGYLIGYICFKNEFTILNIENAEYYINSLTYYSTLFYASIAGFWLFLSGLIAGYFDNRANYLNLESRYYYHPLLQKILKENQRKRVAKYLYENHGSIAGNFFFGILLGITPFFGYLLNLPLDISHIAFSVANLGIFLPVYNSNIENFFIIFIFIFMIGFINLSISFILALKISLKSRDVEFGSMKEFLNFLLIEFKTKPKNFFFPK